MTKSAPAQPLTKIELIRRKLRTRRGATISELCEDLGWRRHSVRAAISGLRKQGCAVKRRPPKSKTEEARYSIAPGPGRAR